MSFSGEAKLEIRVALHDSPGKKLTSAMGLNDEKVKGILGQEAWEILYSSVTSGELHALKMKETARKLHPSVGGNHQRTMIGGQGQVEGETRTGTRCGRCSAIGISWNSLKETESQLCRS